MISVRVLLSVAACAVLVGGCKKAQVESYRVPKEAVASSAEPAGTGAAAPMAGTPAAGGGAAMAGTAVSTASGPGLAWTAPARWTAKPASAMRKGSYAVKGDGAAGEAELSITAFPGDVGGDLANLNRWRGQVNLPPVAQLDAQSGVQRLERNGLKLLVVDLAGAGADAKRILGAIVPHGGSTWFFKLMGPDATVAKEKPVFMEFLDSVKPASSAP